MPPGTNCIDPPNPNVTFNMLMDPSVNRSALFGDNDEVPYICKPGYYFIDERSKTNEPLTCLGGAWIGNFTGCVKSKSGLMQQLSL